MYLSLRVCKTIFKWFERKKKTKFLHKMEFDSKLQLSDCGEVNGRTLLYRWWYADL